MNIFSCCLRNKITLLCVTLDWKNNNSGFAISTKDCIKYNIIPTNYSNIKNDYVVFIEKKQFLNISIDKFKVTGKIYIKHNLLHFLIPVYESDKIIVPILHENRIIPEKIKTTKILV